MSTTIYATAKGLGKWTKRPATSARVNSTEPVSVTAYALTDRPSDWIAHRNLGNVAGWTVTHAPTGLSLPTGQGATLDAAKRLILSLASNVVSAAPEAMRELPYGIPPSALPTGSPARFELDRVRDIFMEWREVQRENAA